MKKNCFKFGWKLTLENNGPRLGCAGCQSKIRHTDLLQRPALPGKSVAEIYFCGRIKIF